MWFYTVHWIYVAKKYVWTSVSHVVQNAIIIEASTKMITLFQIPFYYTHRYKILLVTSVDKNHVGVELVE